MSKFSEFHYRNLNKNIKGGKTTMKKELIAIIVLVIIGSVIIWAAASDEKNTNNMRKPVVLNPLPKSLDTYYPTGGPPIYLQKMFDIAVPMEGIGVNAQEGDWINAKISFQKFVDLYRANSELVPEWKLYFDMNLIKKIGKDIDENSPAIFMDMEQLGESCDKCHTENKPQVWVKYYWKDFDKIDVNTINSAEPTAPWPDAMAKYLASNFDGMAINLAEGKRDAANQSFDGFKAQFLNFKDACKICHDDIERKYFVSSDVLTLVDQLGDQVKAGNLAEAGPLMGQIGDNCYKCHILHEPAQKMRILMER